jgi:hypothetical protein
LIFQAVLLVVGGIILGVLWYEGQFRKEGSFSLFIKCMANLYGLSLIMIFLGYGIIELPRKFFLHSSLEKSIDYEYY